MWMRSGSASWAPARPVCRLDVHTELPVLVPPAPVAQPVGLSLGWTATPSAQESTPGHHHGWITGLCLTWRRSAKHVLCRFHHQQGVTHWLKQHFATAAEINARKPAMKRLFQTRDSEPPVRRRLARLRERAPALGITPWVSECTKSCPSSSARWGVSAASPLTSNAAERFFRAFQRFYRTRGGFDKVLSAKRELLLFLVVYMFTQHATTGQAPIEVIMPEARRMPVYRSTHHPLPWALQERGNVKGQPQMAAFRRLRRCQPILKAGRP